MIFIHNMMNHWPVNMIPVVAAWIALQFGYELERQFGKRSSVINRDDF